MSGRRRRSRVLQVHPLGRCNLTCAHCYSTSSPQATSRLAPGLLTAAIDDAAAAGYDVLAVSGGEPLLYGELERLVDAAQAAGMRATVTTNGTLLDRRRLARLRRLDLLAISIDGPPESHDRMRGRDAFARMQRHLPGLRASGIPFGLLFTLTQRNVHELEWVADFAVRQGAALLQVHPLETAGRAATELPDERPDPVELQWALVEVARLRELHGEQLALHLDALPAVRAAGQLPPRGAGFAETVHPLVVEADGTVVPLSHGFDRRWQLGSLLEAPLVQLIDAYVSRLPAFRAELLAPAAQVAEDGAPLVNWHELVAAQVA